MHAACLMIVLSFPFFVTAETFGESSHEFNCLSHKQIVLSTIYVLSPVDIVPEGNGTTHCFFRSYQFTLTIDQLFLMFTAVFGFIGLLDDFLILLIVFLHVAAIYRSVLLYRHGGS